MSKTPEEFLEEAKKLIGSETEPVQGRYPVEYDPIRRYCHMTDDTNPLFLDSQYAENSSQGTVVCPPLLVGNFASAGLWPPPKDQPALPPVPTPGDKNINLTTEYEFFKPVKIGDRLSIKSRIADIYIKSIKLDPKAFWTKTERIITNQDDEIVAVATNLGVRHRAPEEVKAAGDA